MYAPEKFLIERRLLLARVIARRWQSNLHREEIRGLKSRIDAAQARQALHQ
jgi:hypothetical protein